MEHVGAVEIAIVVGAFIGTTLASFVAGTRKGHRKAILEGAPDVFGESFLRRAESFFKVSHEHAQMLQAHELKITTISAGVAKIEAQFALAEIKIGVELKELRELISKLREDIASLRGALGIERRRDDRGHDDAS